MSESISAERSREVARQHGQVESRGIAVAVDVSRAVREMESGGSPIVHFQAGDPKVVV